MASKGLIGMTEKIDTEEHVDNGQGKMFRRRGLIAGAAAVAAGVIAAKTADSVKANGEIITVGSDISGITVETHLSGSTGQDAKLLHLSQNGQGVGLDVIGSANHAIYAWSGSGDGINSTANAGGSAVAGVHGFGSGTTGNGVIGEAIGGASAYGVWGKTDSGKAVIGTASSSGIGVQGNALGSGYGVQGISSTSHGVVGTANNGNGVSGQSNSGYGVQGISTTLHGVYGEAGTGQGAGALVGVAKFQNSVAFQAVCQAPATNAGYFVGNVSVFGSLGVSGGKFAVVKGQDGQYRGMYAVESPECWFEDFGTGKIAGGKAMIAIDPLFAQHVRTDADYHVFITEHGENNSLHVASRTTTGFTVQADDTTLKAKGKSAADVNGTFSYRVVGKRSDIKGERLPIWEMPQQATLATVAPLVALEPPKPMGPLLQVQPQPQSRPAATSTASPGTSSKGGTQNPVQPLPPSRP